jgi:hypothetical protein
VDGVVRELSDGGTIHCCSPISHVTLKPVETAPVLVTIDGRYRDRSWEERSLQCAAAERR